MITFLLIIGFSLFFIYWFLIRTFTHWSSKEVPQFSVPKLWWEGIKTILQVEPLIDIFTTMYKAFPNARYSGMYLVAKPVLLIKDPELIKQMSVRDFDYFTDHNQFTSEECEPLWGKNLASLKGERWKEMRTTLSPSFTSSKMKGMFGFMSECAENFVQHFHNDSFDTMTVELKDAFTRYTNDVIASASFGISCNSLSEPENKFYLMGKQISDFSGFWRNLAVFMMMLAPRLAKFFQMRMINYEVSSFFRNLVIGNMEEREKNGIVRLDMIHLLMEAKKGKLKHETNNQKIIDTGFAVLEESALGKEEKMQKTQLTNDDVIAQALMFFFAGFDSVATIMCFTAYELAVNPAIQDKLQKEIHSALIECEGKVTYEILLKMEYLDMVISETLRKWINNVVTDRICVKPYTIQPERDGEKPVHINKGDLIWFPIYPLHRDEKYFPNPDRFDPERFNNENKGNIIPYTFLPFGVGPRSCIGNRFALLESKILLFHILRIFEIVVVEKSIVPIKISRKQFNLTAEGGFWFGFKPRKQAA